MIWKFGAECLIDMKKIIEFQREVGLKDDGIIGPMTLNALQSRLNISKVQLANFMGQLHHESNGFKSDTESLNYSVARLINTFFYYNRNKGQAFTDGRRWLHPADQETIANKVYWDVNREKRHWLGNKDWGDGWKFRGRGAIQITGRYNYAQFETYVGYDLMDHPEKVATDLYWECALWYFEKNRLWGISERLTRESIAQLTTAINGGLLGLEERIRMTRYYANILKV